jgi:peptidoglycan hydrolase FlgJ
MDVSSSTVSLAGQRGLAADSKSLNNLKALAGKDSKAAIKETARQFEALFMRELLKSMRDATMKSGLMDSEQGDFATDMLDQQYAQQMVGLPRGLGAMIERQLSQQIAPNGAGAGGGTPSASAWSGREARSTVDAVAAQARAVGNSNAGSGNASAATFVSQHNAAAQQVARESGIPAAFMLGQAAHETGWGRSHIQGADGSNSFNLFGIKAGPGWNGKVAEITTTEYIGGQPRKVVAKFRAYDSYADSFRDYARLIGNNPRYAKVMDNLHSPQSFAANLQQAGYATDPQYASKLSRVIQTAMNLQRTAT